MQGAIAVAGKVVLDVLRVDDPAVPQEDPLLLAVEVDIVPLLHAGLPRGIVVQEPLDRPASHQVLPHDGLHIRGGDLRVERLSRMHHHDGTLRAEAEAPGATDLHLSVQPAPGHLLTQRLTHLDALGGGAAGARAHGDEAMIRIAHSRQRFRWYDQVANAHGAPRAFFTRGSNPSGRRRPITFPSRTAAGASAHEPRQ